MFVDEAARTVHWWHDDPQWLSVENHCDALWPGWTLAHDDRGTRGHVERSGRPLSAIRLPRDEQRKQLAEALTRLQESMAPAELVSGLLPRLDELIERVDGF